MTIQDARLGALRLLDSYEGDGKPKGYKKTVAFLDEESRNALFTGDVVGHVAKSQVDFHDPSGDLAFSIKPNRIVLPSRWAIRDAQGLLVGTLVQKVFGKGAWAGEDDLGNERFRAVDPQPWKRQLAQQVLGGATTRYVLVEGETLLGAVQEEKLETVEQKGIKGFLKTLVTPSKPVLRLAPPAASVDLRLLCGVVLLLFEITVPLDRST